MLSKLLCSLSVATTLAFLFSDVALAEQGEGALATKTAAVSAAGNWGHWRGESGNGVSSTANPPTEWSDTKNVKWKVAIAGKGSGSPVIWNDQVFVVTAVSAGGGVAKPAAPAGDRQRRRGGGGGRTQPGKTSFQLLCFDRETGAQRWQKVATESTPHMGKHSTNTFASASPCTDGKHVYAFFGSYGLYCYTMSGELVWKRDDFGKMTPRAGFGEGASPTIAGDKIIVPWDHEGPSSLHVLNNLTGETIWKKDREEPTNWVTPMVVKHAGKQQVVMSGDSFVIGYDLDSGEELWRCGGQAQRPVASPVTIGDLVIVTSGHRGAFMGAFNLAGRGNLKGTENVAWSKVRDTPDIASPLLSGDRLYYHKAKTGILSCVDAMTGEPHYSTVRVAGLTNLYASPVAAGGHVYTTDRKGTTVVIEDGPKFKIVATNSVGETVDATPAPVGDTLFIRGEKHLFCISE